MKYTTEEREYLIERFGTTRGITDGSIARALQEFHKHQSELSKYNDFEIIYRFPKKKTKSIKAWGVKQAFVECDRLINYDEGSDVTLVLKQAGRTIRSYYQREWYYCDEGL